jgi:hypothetical protein
MVLRAQVVAGIGERWKKTPQDVVITLNHSAKESGISTNRQSSMLGDAAGGTRVASSGSASSPVSFCPLPWLIPTRLWRHTGAERLRWHGRPPALHLVIRL